MQVHFIQTLNGILLKVLLPKSSQHQLLTSPFLVHEFHIVQREVSFHLIDNLQASHYLCFLH